MDPAQVPLYGLTRSSTGWLRQDPDSGVAERVELRPAPSGLAMRTVLPPPSPCVIEAAPTQDLPEGEVESGFLSKLLEEFRMAHVRAGRRADPKPHRLETALPRGPKLERTPSTGTARIAPSNETPWAPIDCEAAFA